MILPCTCKNEYQDKEYGKGNRVHNPCKKNTSARCTVCGKEQAIKKETVEVKK